MKTDNEHLVAVDAGAPHACVVVCMPPKDSLSVDGAIFFAAHLVAKANAALAEKGLPISTPRGLFDKIQAFVAKPLGHGMRRSPDGRIVLTRPMQFFAADDAITFAAALVAVADPDRNMLVEVAAVVEAARGGRALERELHDPRAAVVNLSEPRRAVRLAEPPSMKGRVERMAENLVDADADEHTEEKKRMKGGA